MKRWLIVLACAAMLTALGAIGAVSVQQESQSGTYRVYFREADLRAADGGDALRAEERSLRDEGLSTQQLAELLVEELLHGPMDPTLVSPIPQGTILTAAEQLGTEIHIDLSSAYGTLSGVSLSLADYAITMTLSQLPDVARVRVTVRGSDSDYRSRQIFHARDVLLAPKEDVVGTVEVRLYFPDAEGWLAPEVRTLTLYEGDTQVSAVVRAMENGPESKELQPVIPEGFKVRKVWLEEETCYVSLSSALLEGQTDTAALEQAIRALETSLLSLESVGEVRFLVDGEFAETYGAVILPVGREN